MDVITAPGAASAVIAAADDVARSDGRLRSITFAPFLAQVFAITKPVPDVVPVTAIVFP
jgi:hypothetical protein